MKCLTIKQPYVDHILAGLKTVENRNWRTSYRGPLLIHAGLVEDRRSGLESIDGPGYGVRGAIVGTAMLVDILSPDEALEKIPITARRYVEGECCWLLANVRILRTPIFCRGKLGLWDYPIDDDALRAALAPT